MDDDTGELAEQPRESFRYRSANPALGITQALGKGFAAFANVARNTRVPTVIELGCADPQEPCRLPAGLQSDPYLKQVRSASLEAGMRFGHGADDGASFALFRTDNRDDILFRSTSVTGQLGFFENFERTRHQGLDAEWHARLGAFALGLGYSRLDATYQADGVLRIGERNVTVRRGTRIAGLPRHMLKASADWNLAAWLPGFSVGADLQAFSRRGVAGNEDGLLEDDGNQRVDLSLPGYGVVNLRAAWKPPGVAGLEVFARVTNVAGRASRASVRWARRGSTRPAPTLAKSAMRCSSRPARRAPSRWACAGSSDPRFQRSMDMRITLRAAAVLLAAVAGPAAAEDTGLAYVSSEKDNAIAMIDTKTLAVVGTIPTCKRPRHMQLLAGGAQMVVACGDSNEADVIDLATRKSVARVPLGDDPEAFDLSPDGKTLYVSNEENGELSFIDMATRKRTAAVKVGQEPEGVKVSPDGKQVFVTSEVANMVHAIDIASAKVVKNILVGKRPRRFAFNADASELWVSNELDASVSVIGMKNLAVTRTIKFEVKGLRAADITPVDLKLARDGKTMYVTLGRANRVAFVDVASGKVGEIVLAGKRAWGLALNPDGSRLWVANGLSDDVTVIDTAAAKPLKSIKAGRVPYGIVVN